MNDLIKDLKDLYAKATPGEWYFSEDRDDDAYIRSRIPDNFIGVTGVASAALIVAMRNALPELIAGYCPDAAVRANVAEATIKRLVYSMNEIQSRAETAEAERDALINVLPGFCGVCPVANTEEYRNCPRPMEECHPLIAAWAAQEAAKAVN